MRRFWGLLIMVGGAIGAWFAIGAVLWQARAVRQFVAVPCTIVSAEVQRHSGKHTTWSPEIRYRYEYRGRTYESTRVLPFSESGERSWAENIVRRFDPSWDRARIGIEQNVPAGTAYVDPEAPADSVLVRQYSLMPYLLSLLALLATGMGGGMLLGLIGSDRDKMVAVPLDERFLLLPTRSNRARSLQGWTWLGWMVVATVPLALHWARVAGRASGVVVLGMIAAAAIVIFGRIAVRRWSVARHLSDARVLLSAAPLERGTPCTVELEADAYSPLRVKNATVAAICTEHFKEKSGTKTVYGTRKKGERRVALCQASEVPAGQMVSGKGELLILREELPPTTDIAVKRYPYYTWAVRVDIELEGMVDYAGVFPVTVT